jgi:hypothetical protein
MAASELPDAACRLRPSVRPSIAPTSSAVRLEFAAGQHVQRGDAIALALGESAHVAGADTNTEANSATG